MKPESVTSARASSGASRRTVKNVTVRSIRCPSINPLAWRLGQEAFGEQTVLDAKAIASLKVSNLGAMAGLQILHGALDRRGNTLHIGDFIGGELLITGALPVVLLFLERQEIGFVHPCELVTQIL